MAWRLHDAYSFPIELTQLMAEEKKLTIDMQAFEEAKVCARLGQEECGSMLRVRALILGHVLCHSSIPSGLTSIWLMKASWFCAICSCPGFPIRNPPQNCLLHTAVHPFCVCLFSPPQQVIGSGTGGDLLNFDEHVISKLKSKGLPPTNDLPKYNYAADEEDNYSK